MRDVIRPMIELNFGKDYAIPEFSFVIEEPVDVAAFGAGIEKLVKAGTKVSQDWVRGKIGAPAPKDGEELVVQHDPPKPEGPGSTPGPTKPVPAVVEEAIRALQRQFSTLLELVGAAIRASEQRSERALNERCDEIRDALAEVKRERASDIRRNATGFAEVWQAIKNNSANTSNLFTELDSMNTRWSTALTEGDATTRRELLMEMRAELGPIAEQLGSLHTFAIELAEVQKYQSVTLTQLLAERDASTEADLERDKRIQALESRHT